MTQTRRLLTLTAGGVLTAGFLLAAPATTASAAPRVAPVPATVAALGAVPSVVPMASTWTTVRYGSRGEGVKAVQRVVGTTADGVFGVNTLAKVKAWQGAHDLVADGIVGSLTAAAMKLTEPAPTPSSSVITNAKKYLGIDYVYGGSSPSTGFDCSGFTQYVFAKSGKSLPRTAAQQQAAATRVTSPKPGDLVFWGSPAHHVGIYASPGMMYDSGRPGLKTQLRPIFSGMNNYGRR